MYLFTKKTDFLSMCAQRDLSYHLIYVPWHQPSRYHWGRSSFPSKLDKSEGLILIVPFKSLQLRKKILKVKFLDACSSKFCSWHRKEISKRLKLLWIFNSSKGFLQDLDEECINCILNCIISYLQFFKYLIFCEGSNKKDLFLVAWPVSHYD